MSEEKKQASDEVKDEEKKEGGKVDVEVIEGEKGGDEKPVEGDAKVEEEKVVEQVDAPVDGDAKVEEEKVDAQGRPSIHYRLKLPVCADRQYRQ